MTVLILRAQEHTNTMQVSQDQALPTDQTQALLTSSMPPQAVAPMTVAQDAGPDITEVKPSWVWIRDSKGYGSVTVTLVFVSFWVTTLSYVMSMFDKIGPISIRPFDVAACASYFTPILALYLGRKYTDAKFGS